MVLVGVSFVCLLLIGGGKGRFRSEETRNPIGSMVGSPARWRRWSLLHLRGWTYLSSSMERRPGARLIVLVTRRHHGAADRLFVVVRHRRAAAMGSWRRRGGKKVIAN